MFNNQEPGAITNKLEVFTSGVRWIACLVAGFWLGRFLVSQDPIELISAVVAFALVHLGGLLLKMISGNTDAEAEADADAQGASAANEEEELMPTQE